ncbi:hypothetical protein [Rhodovulum euryhalinum]|uniref:Arginine transporter n=1 Tax=Rhodovulum euryhalinum TaxID=35805 RepID=A0A4V2SAD7_9RHOB|nr:hypothetical protein [Rhodovulum euryhalinum]TCO71270.1 hypothetical protein EV655_107166 [Rhodovulum euryhalinum]
MKTFAFAAALAVFSVPVIEAHAGPIESACLRSDRPGASRGLCGCIQNAADLTLTRGDQKQAARFFRDPHEAQEVRQSDRRRDAAFWERYRRFGATAEAFCS